jgi:hypothetical protein
MQKTVKISQLQVNKDNPRAITEYMLGKLIESILIFSDMLAYRNIVISKERVILGGNQRFLALKAISQMDFNEILDRLLVLDRYTDMHPDKQFEIQAYWEKWLSKPVTEVIIADDLTEAEQKEFIVRDNVRSGYDNTDILKEHFDINEIEGYTGNVDQNLFDFKDRINDKNIENNPIGLSKLKCGYVVSILSEPELTFLMEEYNASVERNGSDEFFVREVLLCK